MLPHDPMMRTSEQGCFANAQASGAADMSNNKRNSKGKRVAEFIRSCIRLRSIRLALWVDAYDNYDPKKGAK